jgi:colanic acid/amylovoran biosynthesis protein
MNIKKIKEKTNLILRTIFLVLKDFTSHYFFSQENAKNANNYSEDNVIIVGGELFNKGAQAMTFTVVDQIKKHLPNISIYLFSALDSDEVSENLYKFKIINWRLKDKFKIYSQNYKTSFESRKSRHEEIEKIIKNTKYIIDISGYGLTAEFGFESSIGYLLNIMIARKYSIPYYILPQSIGPFNYPVRHRLILYPLIKKYLNYPEKIFVREEQSLSFLHRFIANKAIKKHDIVLSTTPYDLSNVYMNSTDIRDIEIVPNSVGIIPNARVIERADSKYINDIYTLLIKILLKANKKVYLIRHSYEDLPICQGIKKIFHKNNSVELISDDLSAVELEKLISKFDMIIASRYHSIIHAYSNNIPVLAIGWAFKYDELLNDFDQLQYYIDIRKNVPLSVIEEKLYDLLENIDIAKIKIEENMHNIKKEKVINEIS